MLDLSCDDVLLCLTVETREAFEGQVIRFSCTTCENDLSWVGTNQISDLLTSIFACFLS